MGAVARILAENVSLRINSVDRIGIGAYIPALVHEGGLVAFLLRRVSRHGIPSLLRFSVT